MVSKFEWIKSSRNVLFVINLKMKLGLLSVCLRISFGLSLIGLKMVFGLVSSFGEV